MDKLNFPPYPIQFKQGETGITVFDVVRRKYLMLTPEENVRQHLIWFLKTDKGFPYSLMRVESQLSYNGLKKRIDLMCYSNDAKPVLLCECKRPQINLTDETLFQISMYNSQFSCPYLLITNGLKHYCFKFNHTSNKYDPISELPYYTDLAV